MSGYANLLPADKVVIEILEDVAPQADVIRAVERLKTDGYVLALDDFVPQSGYEPLVALADIVKIDWLITTGEEDRRRAVENLAPRGIQLLAEKVETEEEYRSAQDMGCTYFQGYFFSKPEIVSGKKIPALVHNNLRILQEVQKPELDYQRIDAIIKQDVSLCFKFLRLCNSAFFGIRHEITSVRLAMALLGEKTVRKWVSLITTASMGKDKPQQFIIQALCRAKFCEELASGGGFLKTLRGVLLARHVLPSRSDPRPATQGDSRQYAVRR